jgi:surface-anchored protein
MWTSGPTPKVWMSTFSNSSTNDYHYAEGTHNHINWGFNTTGIHRVRLRASAFAGPGSSNPTGSSEVHTFTFAIGPFAQWQAQYFDGNELENTSISGVSADPDQDGMNNLIEFGFGLNPRSGGSTPTATGLGLPKMSLQSENGTSYEILTYPRRRANSQIKPLLYQPLFASDLAGPWVSGNTMTTTSNFPIELNHLNSIWELVIVTRPVGTTKPVRGFSRVMLQN